MKSNISLWQFAGFACTSLGGTLLHFLYDWTDENSIVAAFSGVNESTWEHMKLLFWPLFIFALIQRRSFQEYEQYWWIKLAGAAVGLLLIPILFYTITGSFGETPDWVNIAIFFISSAGAFLVETWLFRKDALHIRASYLPFIALCLLGILFVYFTYATPRIPLFQDPQSGSYGIGIGCEIEAES